MVERLRALRSTIQSMCFYWKDTQTHGYCKQANGAGRVCSFCEIVEKLEAILNDKQS